jgi:predicted lipoprotein with Yx(FWY)xxD motif
VAKHLAVTAALSAAVALGACGSSSKTASTNTSTSAAAPAAAQTSSTSSSPYSSTSGASGSSGTGVIVSTKHAKGLGTILASGSKHLTVYLFEADHGTTPTCTGTCEQVWPPLKASGQASAAGEAMAAHLGTTTRPDGTKQVTYNGHPLYFYAKDGDSGDAYGQAIKSFGADWYVLKPSGSKVDTS